MKTSRLEVGDAALVQSLVKQFYGRDVSTASLVKFLSKPANFFIVVETEGQVVGLLSAHEIDSLTREDAAAMFIYEIDVAEGYRRRGAGTALINHIWSIADEKQMFEMFVFTNHSNTEAVAFYKATGGQIEDGDELMFVYTRPGGQSP